MPSKKCEHGRRKTQCKECNGGSICEHGRRKSTCKECGGSSICEHGRVKSQCKECGGSSICEHGRVKSKCKECGGSEICEHGRRKCTCKECGGSSICEHGRRKYQCKECGGSAFCEHGREKCRCKECGGSSICEHGRRKSQCAKCGGTSMCPNCITWIDARLGSKKYDGFCATCFKRNFPDDPRSKIVYEHTKEIRVRNTINENFEGFIHDKPIYTGNCDCTHRRRIDHRKLIEGTLLCIETDEFAHSRYDKKDEELRYDDLYMVYSGKWIFVRFNPDGKGVDIEDKLDKLVEEIETQIERIETDENTDLVEIIKLFY